MLLENGLLPNLFGLRSLPLHASSIAALLSSLAT